MVKVSTSSAPNSATPGGQSATTELILTTSPKASFSVSCMTAAAGSFNGDRARGQRRPSDSLASGPPGAKDVGLRIGTTALPWLLVALAGHHCQWSECLLLILNRHARFALARFSIGAPPGKGGRWKIRGRLPNSATAASRTSHLRHKRSGSIKPPKWGSASGVRRAPPLWDTPAASFKRLGGLEKIDTRSASSVAETA